MRSSCRGAAWSRALAIVLLLPGSAIAQPEENPDPVVPQAPVMGQGNPVQSRPMHPPFEQIPPIPLPQHQDGIPGAHGPAIPLMHDAATGQTVTLPPSTVPGSLLSEGFMPEEARDSMIERREGFGTMTSGHNLTEWPARANVKLIMRFVDTTGANHYFTASGSMIDAKLVLTAGHCVYIGTDRSNNVETVYNAWASEVWVYPAWDGVAGGTYTPPTTTDVIQNYGWAHATTFWSYTGWTGSADYEYDIGVIGLDDRPLGMLTGAFGYGGSTSCSAIEGRTWYNFSYPADNCGGGLHTGRTQYFWSGTWDNCPFFSYQLRINTLDGCLTALWGGMSGSGAYYINTDSSGFDRRYVQAVCSNGRVDNSAGFYVLLRDSMIGDLNSYREQTRGNVLDIAALEFRTQGATTIRAGSGVPRCRVRMSNATNASAEPRAYTVRFYLSTDEVVTSADTLIATYRYNGGGAGVRFGAMQSLIFNVPGLVIPATMPAGQYWLGCILAPGTDANDANNNTNTWDAQSITVIPPQPPNDRCEEAALLFPGNSIVGTTLGADTDGVNGCFPEADNDVWYIFFPECTAQYSIDTCTSTFDTVMSIHRACPGNDGNQIACNDDNGDCDNPLGSRLVVNLFGGRSYYIRVAGRGAGAFTIHSNQPACPPPNDSCEQAISAFPGQNALTTLLATDGPAECTNFKNDVWFVYRPSYDAIATIDTCGSNFDSSLAVYDRCGNDGPRRLLACNDDSCGTGSSVQIAVQQLQTYYIRVGVARGAPNIGTLNIATVPNPVPGCVADVDDGSGTGVPDGGVTIDDLLYYLFLFTEGDLGADVDDGTQTGVPDGGITIDDLLYYLLSFEAGC